MKKALITLIFVLIIFLVGCDSSTTLYTGPIEIGYSAGGGAAKEFPGWVAFTIPNPVLDEGVSTDIIFEYGHDYDSNQYDLWYETHSIAVFVSPSPSNYYRNRDEYTTLYEENVEDFVTDEYLVSGDIHNLFGEVEFHKSFVLSISSSDIPYEHGRLYFVLCRGVFYDDMEINLMTIYKTITFNNSDGKLVFYE
ncbi:MAG: hypothetical protein JEZ05_04860 [Tenericutes bacterium]|nr:hypothetical protein [Mycoplasmatota bacterium]